MATYKDSTKVKQSTSAIFDGTHKPGTPVPHSGIYRCAGCGREAACNKDDPLPPQSHHQHGLISTVGPIAWQLLVATS